jgi:uncharacterized membrane protein
MQAGESYNVTCDRTDVLYLQVPHESCRQVPVTNCRDVPQQKCTKVPHEVCGQVSFTIMATLYLLPFPQVAHKKCRKVPNQVCEDHTVKLARKVCDTPKW